MTKFLRDGGAADGVCDLEETGLVTAVNGGVISVQFERKAECEKCKMCAFPAGSKNFNLELDNTIGAKEGDRVLVHLSGGYVVMSSFLVYIIPLLFCFIGLLIGFLTGNDLLTVVLAVSFLVLGFLAAVLTEKLLKKKRTIKKPEVIKIIE